MAKHFLPHSHWALKLWGAEIPRKLFPTLPVSTVLATGEHLEQVNTTWDTAILTSRSLLGLVAKSQPGSVLWLQAQPWLSSQAQRVHSRGCLA